MCARQNAARARIKPEFDRRDVMVIGLSVDPVADHARWAREQQCGRYNLNHDISVSYKLV